MERLHHRYQAMSAPTSPTTVKIIDQAGGERGGVKRKSLPDRILDKILSLHSKLIIPYLTLSLFTAMVGIFVVTRLVASSIRERYANQLLEASRVAGDGIVRQERVHLEQLRLMAFTQGIPEAILMQDADLIQQLLLPLMLNEDIHSLTAVSLGGQEIVSIIQEPLTNEYAISQGADLFDLDLVSKTLSQEIDQFGDKYAEVIQTFHGPSLMTSIPVKTQAEELTGVLIVGSGMDGLLTDLKTQSLADVTILDSLGQLMSTTIFAPEEGYEVLELSAAEVSSVNPALTRELTINQRQYQIYYSPLVIREQQVGTLGVLLPSNFVVSAESTSRNLLSFIFTFGTTGIIFIGLFLARNISRPVKRLRDASLEVASGNLDHRSGLRRRDEIGQLAAVFDLMTFRLRKRTAQTTRLYQESLKRNDELAEINQRFQQSQQQLVQSEKLASVGYLTAGIVHEVRNPLAVIKGIAEEAIEEVNGNRHIADRLGLIVQSASKANTIVQDLLKFARQSKLEFQLHDIRETVVKTLRMTDHMAKKASVLVMPELGSSPVMATYDALQIEQVLLNLIQNAIQAMAEGGTLAIRVSEQEEFICLSVQDTGAGIPAKNLKRIFDPFFTTKPEGVGTGLGLSVSYGIMAQHQGAIEVNSAEGVGTTFTLKLRRILEPVRESS
jgi:signal transduction histidine kinase